MPVARFIQLVLSWCRLRGSPADAPWSTNWLVAMLLVSLLLDVASGSWLGIPGNVPARSLLSSAVLLTLVWLALGWRRRQARFVQTGIALLACALVFSLLMLPVALAVGLPSADTQPLSPQQAMLVWLALGIVLWKLVVDAHILRAALEVPAWSAMLIAAGFAMTDWVIGNALFATPVTG